MAGSYDLSQLTPITFEHLVNSLALQVLGAGHAGFGPGPDGGRDGLFEGEAPYPSAIDHWSGRWYIQSKFHGFKVSGNEQSWLLEQIKDEIHQFSQPGSSRHWPDNWIIATNVNPSPDPVRGTFDRARALVAAAQPKLASRFDIWGGDRIIDFLSQFPEVARHYGHFLTPGHVLTSLYDSLHDERANLDHIIYALVHKALGDQQHTKLDHAGSQEDQRPKVHQVFTDVPFTAAEHSLKGYVLDYLVRATSRSQRTLAPPTDPAWALWARHPARAGIWFLRGGPGQGKSTVGQYFCQVQRAALLLQKHHLTPAAPSRRLRASVAQLAGEIEKEARKAGHWPTAPRIPVYMELREYAAWYARQPKDVARGVVSYLAVLLLKHINREVLVGTLDRLLSQRAWFFVFDGLDEVPADTRDLIAGEIQTFVDWCIELLDCDLHVLCTSRPQGYKGQFSRLDGTTLDLAPLSAEEALRCALPVIAIGRSREQAERATEILKTALDNGVVRELMTTPLQSHIMAVIVRDGRQPPERRWDLFDLFYKVIYRREANRKLTDQRLSILLERHQELLRSVHNHLGFALHAQAERSTGAGSSMSRGDFCKLVRHVVGRMREVEIEETVNTVMEAITDRLVLLSTPDSGQEVRFDIRQIQEFFAAEFLYCEYLQDKNTGEELRERLEALAGDVHWREVMHFLLSALIETRRPTEASVAIEVLQGLDRGEAGFGEALLRRRYAVGALLVSRLLQDGVLEQDKRTRARFEGCLEPLAGSCAKEDLRPLIELISKNNHTALWLLEFMYQRLLSLDYSESIGAGVILALTLEDTDPRVQAVLKHLMGAPVGYIGLLLHQAHWILSAFSHENSEHYTLAHWVSKLALWGLSRADWYEMNPGVNEAVEFLLATGGRCQQIAAELGLLPTVVELSRLLERTEPGRDSQGEDAGYTFAKIGKTVQAPPAWLATWAGEVADEADPGGIFTLAWRALQFAGAHSRASLIALLQTMAKPGWNALSYLADPLYSLLPVPDSQPKILGLVGEIEKLTDDDFSNDLVNHRLGRHSLRTLYTRTYNSGNNAISVDEFCRLVNDIPALAISLWVDGFSARTFFQEGPPSLEEKATVYLNENLYCVEVQGLLTAAPHHLFLHVPRWGAALRAFAGFPAFAAFLREALCTQAMEKPLLVRSGFNLDQCFCPFVLALPREAPLLVPIVGYLLSCWLVRPVFRPTKTSYSTAERNVTKEIARSYVADVSAASAVADDARVTDDIRLAALCLAVLHPDGGIGVALQRETLLLRMAHSPDSPVAIALGICADILVTQHEPRIRSLLGQLLTTTRYRFIDRDLFAILISRWREESLSPCTGKGFAERWLAMEPGLRSASWPNRP